MGIRTPNELRVRFEEMVRNDTNYHEDEWDFLFKIALDLIDFYTYYLLLLFPYLNLLTAHAKITTQQRHHLAYRVRALNPRII